MSLPTWTRHHIIEGARVGEAQARPSKLLGRAGYSRLKRALLKLKLKPQNILK